MKKRIVKKKVILKNKKGQRKAFSIRSAADVPADSELPVTKGHFDAFRQEISTRMTSMELLIKAGDKKNVARFAVVNTQFASLDTRFAAIDARFAQMDERFAAIDARFAQMDERFAAIDARFAQMDERFAAIDTRFAQMEERFAAIDARFAQMDERFAAIDARFAVLEKKVEDIYVEIRRSNVLFEEQNNRNKLVMDALLNLFNRQETLEKTVDTRIKNIEDIIKVGRA